MNRFMARDYVTLREEPPRRGGRGAGVGGDLGGPGPAQVRAGQGDPPGRAAPHRRARPGAPPSRGWRCGSTAGPGSPAALDRTPGEDAPFAWTLWCAGLGRARRRGSTPSPPGRSTRRARSSRRRTTPGSPASGPTGRATARSPGASGSPESRRPSTPARGALPSAARLVAKVNGLLRSIDLSGRIDIKIIPVAIHFVQVAINHPATCAVGRAGTRWAQRDGEMTGTGTGTGTARDGAPPEGGTTASLAAALAPAPLGGAGGDDRRGAPAAPRGRPADGAARRRRPGRGRLAGGHRRLPGPAGGERPGSGRGGAGAGRGPGRRSRAHHAGLVRPGLRALGAGAGCWASSTATLASTFARQIDRHLQERVMAAVGRPAGVAHLEDPEILDLIKNAQGVGTEGLRPGSAVTALATLLPSWLRALGAAAVLLAFSPWLGLAWIAVWPLVLGVLMREYIRVSQAAGYSAATVRRAQYFVDLALAPGAAKEVRVWGLLDWLVERFQGAWLEAIEPVWRQRRPGRPVVWLSAGRGGGDQPGLVRPAGLRRAAGRHRPGRARRLRRRGAGGLRLPGLRRPQRAPGLRGGGGAQPAGAGATPRRPARTAPRRPPWGSRRTPRARPSASKGCASPTPARRRRCWTGSTWPSRPGARWPSWAPTGRARPP